MFICLHIKYSCQILMKLKFARRIFKKIRNFYEYMFRGSRVVPCGLTDGPTDTMKLIVAFLNFANAPNSGAKSRWNEKDGTVNLKIGFGVVVLGTALNRKVLSSISDELIGSSHWPNPSGRTLTLGWTLRPGPRTYVCQVSRNSGILNLLEM
jgi:hypothetical protein